MLNVRKSVLQDYPEVPARVRKKKVNLTEQKGRLA